MTSWDAFTSIAVTNGEVRLHARRGGSGDPVILVHGWPQHSLMWHTIAPILSRNFDVVCPDLRGAGASTIAPGGYDKTTMASDVLAIADALRFERFHLVGYDLGAGVAAALARDYPKRVRRLVLMEFGLAGFGYEDMMAPREDWTSASNWHLGLFTLPDVGEWLFRGRERELLAWFFDHISFAGQSAVSAEHFETYHRQLLRPGALRAGINYYAAVWQDARDNAALASIKLPMPLLALGGEASSGQMLEQIWSAVAADLKTEIVPQAGHWLGDENPEFVAEAIAAFLLEERS